MLYMPLNSYIQEQTESNFGEFANQNRRFCKPISPKLQSKRYAIKPKSAIDHLTTTFGSMLFLHKKCVVFRKYFIPLHSLKFAESLMGLEVD